MTKLIFVKLGGSVLTDKTQPEALNQPVLDDVAQTLAAALAAEPTLRLLIGHGGGSFGHVWAARYQTQHGARDAHGWQGVARVQDAMGRLNRAVVATLLAAGLSAVGVAPSAGAVCAARELVAWDTTVLAGMLDAGLAPVVHGDVVLDRAQGAAIVSTETVFSFLLSRLAPTRIVLVGERGVWTADPRRDPAATLIPRITEQNLAAVLGQAGASHGVDVTGGMASKVALMWRLVNQQPGLTVQLVGPGDLAAALAGAACGTVIAATPTPAS